MDYKQKKENIAHGETVSKSTAELNIDTEINLPDYCPDIKKVLKCLIETNILVCRSSGDRVTADGESVVRVIYMGETGKVECYETIVPFSKYAQGDGISGECCAYAVPVTEYVNCRAVSQRRISVSGNVSIHFCVSRLNSVAVFSSAEGMGIQMKKESFNADLPVGETVKMFEVTETVAFDDTMPPVLSMMKTDCSAEVTSVKVIADKMLIKGNVNLFILYRADNEASEPVHYTHTMPLSQIVELNGIDEDSMCFVSFKHISVSAIPKTDSNGENKLLDVTAELFAGIKAYQKREIEVISDLYSTDYEINSEYKNVGFTRHLMTYNDTLQIRETVDIPLFVEAMDIRNGSVYADTVKKDNKIIGKGSFTAGILFRKTDGEYDFTEKTVDFSFELSIGDTAGEIYCEPEFEMIELSCSVTGSDRGEIKAKIGIKMPIWEKFEKRVCCDIQIDEQQAKNNNSNVLTVYFSDQGEKLWDIARHYNTTVEAIKEENDITADEVTSNMMLMIPGI